MKLTIPLCIMCESEDVTLWTIDNGRQATVTYVCTAHAAPLEAILEASDGLPLDLQVPLTQRKTVGYQRPALPEPHRRTMVPLDWTPPSEKVTGPTVVGGDVSLAVEFSDDAAEVGAGGDSNDLGTAGAGEVHDLGLQPLEGSDALDGLEHEGRRSRKRAAGNVVVDQVEVA